MVTMQIDPSKIGAVIGSGGKTIRSIQEETGVKIDIEDDGTVFVAAMNDAGCGGGSAAHPRLGGGA